MINHMCMIRYGSMTYCISIHYYIAICATGMASSRLCSPAPRIHGVPCTCGPPPLCHTFDETQDEFRRHLQRRITNYGHGHVHVHGTWASTERGVGRQQQQRHTTRHDGMAYMHHVRGVGIQPIRCMGWDTITMSHDDMWGV